MIEVDGPVHQYTTEQDAVRQEFLEGLGFRVIRFTNQAILDSLDSAIEQIKVALTESGTSKLQPNFPSLRSGEGQGVRSPGNG